MKEIAIIGSTGSIGTQALSVCALHADRFRVGALTAHTNAALLFEQVRACRPRMAGLVVPPDEIPEDLRFCEWIFGEECLRAAATLPEAQYVLVSVVGFAGLSVVLSALKAQKQVLLANKEALVAGGELVMEAARKAGKPILPVDSEHSAVFQCLQGAADNKPSRIILTASGGPFRSFAAKDIKNASVAQALRHPNWAMGKKITIDSASMMNKALEVIEAKWLFAVEPKQIEVLIHKQSVVHSMVAFADGALLAQLGVPDMRLPILYAMAYPERLPTGADALSLEALSELSFEGVDAEKFPSLSLAYEALASGGTACAILNAANEVAVQAFLQERISFGRMYEVTRDVLEKIEAVPAASLEAIEDADAKARCMASKLCSYI